MIKSCSRVCCRWLLVKKWLFLWIARCQGQWRNESANVPATSEFLASRAIFFSSSQFRVNQRSEFTRQQESFYLRIFPKKRKGELRASTEFFLPSTSWHSSKSLVKGFLLSHKSQGWLACLPCLNDNSRNISKILLGKVQVSKGKFAIRIIAK